MERIQDLIEREPKGKTVTMISSIFDGFIRLCKTEEEKEKLLDIRGEITNLSFDLLEYTRVSEEYLSELISHNWRNTLAANLGNSEYKNKIDFYQEILSLPLVFRSYLEPTDEIDLVTELEKQSSVKVRDINYKPTNIEDFLRVLQETKEQKNEVYKDKIKIIDLIRSVYYRISDYGWGDEGENAGCVFDALLSVKKLEEMGLTLNETFGRFLHTLSFRSIASGFHPDDKEFLVEKRTKEIIKIIEDQILIFTSEEDEENVKVLEDYIKKIEIAKRMLLEAIKAEKLIKKIFDQI